MHRNPQLPTADDLRFARSIYKFEDLPDGPIPLAHWQALNEFTKYRMALRALKSHKAEFYQRLQTPRYVKENIPVIDEFLKLSADLPPSEKYSASMVIGHMRYCTAISDSMEDGHKLNDHWTPLLARLGGWLITELRELFNMRESKPIQHDDPITMHDDRKMKMREYAPKMLNEMQTTEDGIDALTAFLNVAGMAATMGEDPLIAMGQFNPVDYEYIARGEIGAESIRAAIRRGAALAKDNKTGPSMFDRDGC